MMLTDAVSLMATCALLLAILVRLVPRSRKTYMPLLWVQVSGIVLLVLSLSWIYPTVDAALGGKNYLNLVSHLIFMGGSWIYTVVLAEPFFKERRRPFTLRLWVPITAAVGAITCFTLLGSDATSRGMEAFTNEPAWIGYWVFNVMTLWMPSFILVPKLWDAVKSTKVVPLAIAYWGMIIGYSASVVVVLGYVVTYFYPELIVVRELFVLITELGLTTALIAIPVLSHQRSSERGARHQAQQKAAARFHK